MLKCTVVSQEKLLYEGDVESVVIPGEAGEMGILTDHSANMTTIVSGKLQIDTINDGYKEFEVEGGFAEVRNNMVTVLTNKATEIKDI